MMNNQLLEHLKNTRLFSECTDKDIDDLLEILRRFDDIELYVINSNISKIETININSNSYIIWDENYWDHYYRYIAIMCSENVYDPNNEFNKRYFPKEIYYHERLIWLESIFLSMLSKRYDKCLSISAILHYETAFKTYDMFEAVFNDEEKKGEHNRFVLPMKISKLLAEFHEISHVIIKKEEAVGGTTEWLSIITNVLVQILVQINSICKIIGVEEKRKNEYIDFINELLEKRNLSYLEELAADALALTNAKHLIFDKYKGNKKLASVFYHTFLLYTQFNWQTNFVFEYWNIYYFTIFNDEIATTDTEDAVIKKGWNVADYYDLLQTPNITRKKIVLPPKRFSRLKDIDIENSFRFGFFNIAMLYMLHFPTAGDQCTDTKDILSINADLQELFSNSIMLTLLNDNYISSRILKAKDLSREKNIEKAKILKHFQSTWGIL